MKRSVPLALRWLAGQQGKNGGWGNAGDTGLAVLAFLGARRVDAPVQRGLRRLVDTQGDDGRIGKTMREHALATLALCEGYFRTKDPRFKLPAQEALDAMYRQGGKWGGDTIWCVMAHWAGRFAGLNDRQELADAAAKRLEGVDGQLARLLRGKDATQGPKQGKRDPAGWYLACLVARRMSGDVWQAWEPYARKKVLVWQKKNGSFGTVRDTAAYTLAMEVCLGYMRVFGIQ